LIELNQKGLIFFGYSNLLSQALNLGHLTRHKLEEGAHLKAKGPMRMPAVGKCQQNEG
jgi:hypothetical protein